MLPVLRLAITGCSIAGVLWFALAAGSSAKGVDTRADLPPELQAEILEALAANPQRQNQCIATNAFTTLVADYPDLALKILEFADVKLPSKRRILGDECTCPIEMATATVLAVPELAVPTRRVMEDRYPECDSEIETAMEEALANLEPGAGNNDRYNPNFPGLRPTEEVCRDTSSASCGFVPDPPKNGASPSRLQ